MEKDGTMNQAIIIWGENMLKRKTSLFFHKLALAWLSCMIFMVQGNVLSLTSKHAIIATKTGVITGLIVVILSFIPYKFYLKLPILMFVGCFFADLISHPSHFGNHYTEALCTALLASIFSYIITLSPAGKKLEEYLSGT